MEMQIAAMLRIAGAAAREMAQRKARNERLAVRASDA
jgi:hypothetical protein